MAHLILVPTPVGNLADITQRAVQVLTDADIIAAEDTRHSGRLLQHLGLDRKLFRLDAHTIAQRAPRLLENAGSIAYLTDAGTPGISDPGEELVRLALGSGHSVEVLPGPTAFVPALVLSGLPLARFTFEGFLPRKGSARRARLEQIRDSTATTVLYEAPGRAASTLKELSEVCGESRMASLSRELSKRFETTYRGTLAELAGLDAAEFRGEIVICVGPQGGTDAPAGEYARLAELLTGEGLDVRTVRSALELAGAPRNTAYGLSLQGQSRRG